MRNRIFVKSQEIKALLANSKDVVLLNSMWDSCIMTITQLDAYFYMIGIFNTIKKEDLTDASVNYLINWLNEIKKTNELNIKSLNLVTKTLEPRARVHKEKLTSYFSELNKQINNELSRIPALKGPSKSKEPK